MTGPVIVEHQLSQSRVLPLDFAPPAFLVRVLIPAPPVVDSIHLFLHGSV